MAVSYGDILSGVLSRSAATARRIRRFRALLRVYGAWTRVSQYIIHNKYKYKYKYVLYIIRRVPCVLHAKYKYAYYT